MGAEGIPMILRSVEGGVGTFARPKRRADGEAVTALHPCCDHCLHTLSITGHRDHYTKGCNGTAKHLARSSGVTA